MLSFAQGPRSQPTLTTSTTQNSSINSSTRSLTLPASTTKLRMNGNKTWLVLSAKKIPILKSKHQKQRWKKRSQRTKKRKKNQRKQQRQSQKSKSKKNRKRKRAVLKSRSLFKRLSQKLECCLIWTTYWDWAPNLRRLLLQKLDSDLKSLRQRQVGTIGRRWISSDHPSLHRTNSQRVPSMMSCRVQPQAKMELQVLLSKDTSLWRIVS